MDEGQPIAWGMGGSVSMVLVLSQALKVCKRSKVYPRAGMQSGTVMETGTGTYGQSGKGSSDENYGSYLAEQ